MVPEARTTIRGTTQHTLLIHGKESTISTYTSLETKALVNYLLISLIHAIHRTLQTAVKSIIPVRNPFDLISTVLYQDKKGLVDVLHRQLNVSLSKKDQQDAPIVVTRYKLAMKELRESGNKEAFQNARYDNRKFIEKVLNNIARRTGRIMEQASMIGWENIIIKNSQHGCYQ